MGLHNGSRGKESTCNAGITGDSGSVLEWGRSPGVGNDNLLQYSCLGNPMTEDLVGYSPWGRKELDTAQ